jgi:hypothetical protein
VGAVDRRDLSVADRGDDLATRRRERQRLQCRLEVGELRSVDRGLRLVTALQHVRRLHFDHVRPKGSHVLTGSVGGNDEGHLPRRANT